MLFLWIWDLNYDNMFRNYSGHLNQSEHRWREFAQLNLQLPNSRIQPHPSKQRWYGPITLQFCGLGFDLLVLRTEQLHVKSLEQDTSRVSPHFLQWLQEVPNYTFCDYTD